ncbi:MAG: MOSC domain-containing protein [Burkholderiales bacterium]
MNSLQSVTVHQGVGLEGDRYALGVGAYSKIEPIKVRHATLITEESIAIANAWFAEQGEPPMTALLTRRNLLIDQISAAALNALVGREFTLGGARFRGLELADPCQRPTRLLGRTGFEKAFDGRGGLRAEALAGGILTLGDKLVC